jgi:hypothetical protein
MLRLCILRTSRKKPGEQTNKSAFGRWCIDAVGGGQSCIGSRAQQVSIGVQAHQKREVEKCKEDARK